MPRQKESPEKSISEKGVAKGVALLLFFAIILSTIISLTVIYHFTGNLKASAYYTLSSIFETNEEGFSTVVFSSIGMFSLPFDAVIGVLIIDGIVKYMLIGFGLAVVLELLSGVDIISKISDLTMGKMSSHIVVCGYSALAERICGDLKKNGIHFLIIDKDPEKIEDIREDGYIPVIGDFTEIDDLQKAYTQDASAIIFCGQNDYTNLLGVVSARKLSKNISIICRARSENTVTKMHRAGAEICIIPELVSGLELGQKLSGV